MNFPRRLTAVRRTYDRATVLCTPVTSSAAENRGSSIETQRESPIGSISYVAPTFLHVAETEDTEIAIGEYQLPPCSKNIGWVSTVHTQLETSVPRSPGACYPSSPSPWP